jgi:integrase
LEKLGIEPISERVTNHSLRRTFTSLRSAHRDEPVYISEQMGHTDPRFTLSVYAKAVKRRERLSGEYREAFDRALEWAAMGTNEEPGPIEAIEAERAEVADPASQS